MHRREISHENRKVAPIAAGPFTFRSFHASDGRYTDQYGSRVENTLDRLVTFTMPVVAFGAELATHVGEITKIVVL